MCVIRSLRLKAIQQTCYGFLCVPLLNPVPIPPCRRAVGNFSENAFCFFIGDHMGNIDGWAAECGFYLNEHPMNDMPSFTGFQVKIFVAKRRYTARRCGSVSHCQCYRMIKVYNCFVLDISDLGAIVDMVFTVPAMLSNGIWVFFARWRNYLKLHSYSKYPIHLTRIHE